MNEDNKDSRSPDLLDASSVPLDALSHAADVPDLLEPLEKALDTLSLNGLSSAPEFTTAELGPSASASFMSDDSLEVIIAPEAQLSFERSTTREPENREAPTPMLKYGGSDAENIAPPSPAARPHPKPYTNFGLAESPSRLLAPTVQLSTSDSSSSILDPDRLRDEAHSGEFLAVHWPPPYQNLTASLKDDHPNWATAPDDKSSPSKAPRSNKRRRGQGQGNDKKTQTPVKTELKIKGAASLAVKISNSLQPIENNASGQSPPHKSPRREPRPSPRSTGSGSKERTPRLRAPKFTTSETAAVTAPTVHPDRLTNIPLGQSQTHPPALDMRQFLDLHTPLRPPGHEGERSRSVSPATSSNSIPIAPNQNRWKSRHGGHARPGPYDRAPLSASRSGTRSAFEGKRSVRGEHQANDLAPPAPPSSAFAQVQQRSWTAEEAAIHHARTEPPARRPELIDPKTAFASYARDQSLKLDHPFPAGPDALEALASSYASHHQAQHPPSLAVHQMTGSTGLSALEAYQAASLGPSERAAWLQAREREMMHRRMYADNARLIREHERREQMAWAPGARDEAGPVGYGHGSGSVFNLLGRSEAAASGSGPGLGDEARWTEMADRMTRFGTQGQSQHQHQPQSQSQVQVLGRFEPRYPGGQGPEDYAFDHRQPLEYQELSEGSLLPLVNSRRAQPQPQPHASSMDPPDLSDLLRGMNDMHLAHPLSQHAPPFHVASQQRHLSSTHSPRSPPTRASPHMEFGTGKETGLFRSAMESIHASPHLDQSRSLSQRSPAGGVFTSPDRSRGTGGGGGRSSPYRAR